MSSKQRTITDLQDLIQNLQDYTFCGVGRGSDFARLRREQLPDEAIDRSTLNLKLGKSATFSQSPSCDRRDFSQLKGL
ncbi:MAG: hypothetical protein AB4290_27880 [Spirulina sp.]